MNTGEKEQEVTLKAGVVLFGDVKGVRHIVTPYSEGRFGNNHKYYVLAKGKPDAGEDMLAAAMRESAEETGIDIRKLLGTAVIEKLHRGETVEHVESGYPGVRIKRVLPNALNYDYLGRESNVNHLTLFAVELEGIEHLQQHLKNPTNRSSHFGLPQEVTYPVRTMLADRRDVYPSFTQCLTWLRDMQMPQATWSRGKAGTPLQPINGKGTHWFRDLEARYMESKGKPGQQIHMIREWQDFQKFLSPEDYHLLREYAEQMKKELKDPGIVKDDTAVVKFDTKDSPLVFYQEGADILTAEHYLQACVHGGLVRSDYTRAFCGNVPKLIQENAPRMQRITSSQLAGVVWSVGDEAIEKVADHYKHKEAKTRKDGKWLGGSMYDDSLRKDLRGVAEHMHKKEKPVASVMSADHQGCAAGKTKQPSL